MASPTEKAPAIEAFLHTVITGAELLGQTPARVAAITGDVCIPAPIGCGGPAIEFRDEISRREYRISGLCQKCQDLVFEGGEE